MDIYRIRIYERGSNNLYKKSKRIFSLFIEEAFRLKSNEFRSFGRRRVKKDSVTDSFCSNLYRAEKGQLRDTN